MPAYLIIDMSSLPSLALVNGSEVLSYEHTDRSVRPDTMMVHKAKSLLAQAGLAFMDLELIAVVVGPGSFTGVRMACALGQGLAYAANVPMLGVSSLQVMAQAMHEKTGAEHIYSAIDARKSEVYFGDYVLDDSTGIMQASQPNLLLGPEGLPGAVWDPGMILVGVVWVDLANELAQRIDIETVVYVPVSSAKYASGLVAKLAKKVPFVSPESVLPVYIRPAV